MSLPSAADARSYPAPGSAVPGAPPSLKRPLTPADGIPDSGQTPSTATEHLGPQRDSDIGPMGGAGLRGAFVLLGVAAGLEIAAVLSRRHRT